MKRLWIFLLIVWAKMTYHLTRITKKQRNDAQMKRAIMFGAEIDRLYRLADKGDIGIDFVHALYNMSTEEYQNRICLGPFTSPSEMKAHLYFANIRQWINIERTRLNESGEEDLPMLDKDDEIVWGVCDDNGKLYIIGNETRNNFDYKPIEPVLLKDNENQ